MPKKFTFEERLRQDILLLTVDDEFFSAVQKMREKYNLPVKEEDIENNGIPYVLEDKDFLNDADELMKKYHLSESHAFVFSNFLLNGNVDFTLSTNFWHLNPGFVSADTETCITLKIYPDTTLKDIQKNWSRIKIYRDDLLNRGCEKKVRIENLNRDLEILRLKRLGKNSVEIAHSIRKDTRFKKVSLGYEDIPKIIRRLKYMAKKNRTRKES